MSKLRPEAVSSSEPALPASTAYYSIYGAVQSQHGLCHGQLHDGHGHHCAIGSLWNATPVTLDVSLIDEVAAVNDSVPKFSQVQRRAHVLRWLRWKLTQLGMKFPGKRPTKKASAA